MYNPEEPEPTEPVPLDRREVLILYWLAIRTLLPRLVVFAGAAALVTLLIIFWLR